MKSTIPLLMIAGFAFVALTGSSKATNDEYPKGDIFTAIRNIDYISLNIHLSEGTDVDTLTEQGNTPLMVAAEVGNLRIIDIILSHNPSLDKQNFRGETALMIAAKTGQYQVVKKLVLEGADLTVTDQNHDTANTLASRYGHADISDYLEAALYMEPIAM